MRPLFELGPRLQKCADLVRPGCRFADIGSDHGYLPIWLLKTGRVQSAVAADINEGPLHTARMNGLKYGAAIETVLSDGFQAVPQEAVEDAVIAGMGGELMGEIIAAAPWLQNPEKHLVLQPMTAAFKLRVWLFENGYGILREEVVREGGKLYSVMQVQFTGKRDTAPMALYMGAILPGSAYSEAYAEKVARDLENRSRGLAGGEKEECLRLKADIERRYGLHEQSR